MPFKLLLIENQTRLTMFSNTGIRIKFSCLFDWHFRHLLSYLSQNRRDKYNERLNCMILKTVLIIIWIQACHSYTGHVLRERWADKTLNIKKGTFHLATYVNILISTIGEPKVFSLRELQFLAYHFEKMQPVEIFLQKVVISSFIFCVLSSFCVLVPI